MSARLSSKYSISLVSCHGQQPGSKHHRFLFFHHVAMIKTPTGSHYQVVEVGEFGNGQARFGPYTNSAACRVPIVPDSDVAGNTDIGCYALFGELSLRHNGFVDVMTVQEVLELRHFPCDAKSICDEDSYVLTVHH